MYRPIRAVKGNPANHLPALTLGGLGVSRILWLVSFSLFAVGLWLFDTFRFRRRAARLEKATGGRLLEGSSTSTDIHNYTGWQGMLRQKLWMPIVSEAKSGTNFYRHACDT